MRPLMMGFLGVAALWTMSSTDASAQWRGGGQCPPGYQNENQGCVPIVRCPPGLGWSSRDQACVPDRPRYYGGYDRGYDRGHYYDDGPRYYRRRDGRAGSGECPPGYQHENRGCVPFRR